MLPKPLDAQSPRPQTGYDENLHHLPAGSNVPGYKENLNQYIHSTKMPSLEDYEYNAFRPRHANQPHVTKKTKIMKMSLSGLLAVATCALLANLWTPSAEACGGFFCTSVPVDQNAERIIFTQNDDGTWYQWSEWLMEHIRLACYHTAQHLCGPPM